MFATLTRRMLWLRWFWLILLAAGSWPPAYPYQHVAADSLTLDGLTPVLTLAGHLGGPALTVAVQDHYAYVGHSFEFAVLDVANPTQPQRVGYLVLSTNDIAVTGDLAYVAARTGLVVVDIGDPTRPTQIGAWPLAETATSVAIRGDYAYVVAKGGLSVIEITRLTAPLGVGFVALPGRLESVSLDGDLAYVTSNHGLHVLDLSTPERPIEQAFVETAGYAEAAITVDGTVYVAAGDQGIQALTLGGAAGPTEAGTTGLTGYAEAVAIHEDHAFVAAGVGGLQVIALGAPRRLPAAASATVDPAQPNLVGSLSLAGYALDVAVAGDYAYVIDRYHGMAIVDIAQPTMPVQVGLFAAPGFTNNVAVAGDRAFVTTAPQGNIRILDLADPTRARQTGAADALDAAVAVAVAGRFAFIAAGYGGLEVVDMSDDGGPVRVARLDTPGYARDVQVVDDYAYVAADSGLQIVDVAAPTRPREMVCVCGAGAVADVAVSGGAAVILGATGRLQWVNLSNPAAPAPVASFQAPGQATAVAYAGGYAAVAAGEQGLRIVALDAAGRLAEIGAYATPGGSTTSSSPGATPIWPCWTRVCRSSIWWTLPARWKSPASIRRIRRVVSPSRMTPSTWPTGPVVCSSCASATPLRDAAPCQATDPWMAARSPVSEVAQRRKGR